MYLSCAVLIKGTSFSGSMLPPTGERLMISFLDIASLCSGAQAFEERKPTTSGGLASPSVDHMHEAIPLSSLTPTFEKADFAPARLNRSFLDRPIMLAGKSYASGLGLHAPIVLKYAVPADAAYLRGIVGLDDEVFECNGHSILFRIHDEDGNLVFDSGLIVSHLEPKPFAVEIKGKKELASQRLTVFHKYLLS